jgi:hypothetical protein
LLTLGKREASGVRVALILGIHLTGIRLRIGGEQRGGFDQAAELLFAGLLVYAFTGLETLRDFVADRESFQFHDANEFVTVFPDLGLSKF